jgi:opacity protein-like surface antigen
MKRLTMLGLGLAGLAATPAHADESLFGYTYGADTLPKGETEFELWATDRRGKDEGHYDAQDYRLELEHGFTNRFTVSGYANFASHHIRGLEPEFGGVDRDFGFQGVSAEFKYNVLSPYKDGFGLTLYAEPGWSRIRKVEGDKVTEYELELKAILQKNFLNDRLIWAANLTLEPEWEHEKEVDETTGEVEKEWEKELAVEVTTGLSYRVASNWYLGVEGRYHSEYPDWTNGLHREHYAFFAGPSIHYGGKKWWATLTYLPQIYGSPNEPGRSLHLEEHEKRELRLKIGYNF